jgi:hypothetical protein
VDRKTLAGFAPTVLCVRVQVMSEDFSLHDATLKTVEFEWSSAVCKIIIELAGQIEAAIIFRGVTWVALPKKVRGVRPCPLTRFAKSMPQDLKLKFNLVIFYKFMQKQWSFKTSESHEEL